MNNEKFTPVLGKVKSREEVLQEIKSNVAVYPTFLDLKKEYQEQFVEFCMGVRGMKMTYDTFFKHIFHAEIHPERLSKMLSAIIGRPLKVKRALPPEHKRITEQGSLLILDIIVEFDTGELADVEIQKVGYLFPGQRAACYSADMLMRQYEREKSVRGEKFTYRDLKKVYTIVLVESSNKDLMQYTEYYIHRGKVRFDTGIEMEMLQEFYFFALDNFFAIRHNEHKETIETELEAWLYFLGSDRVEDIARLLHAYPEFGKLYEDVCRFREQPEVAIMMFSEALRKMDENTVKYMIEEQKKEILEQQEQISEQQEQISEQQEQISEQQKQISEQQKEISVQRQVMEELRMEIDELKSLLHEKKNK